MKNNKATEAQSHRGSGMTPSLCLCASVAVFLDRR